MFLDIKGIQFFKKEKICFVDKNSKSVFFIFFRAKTVKNSQKSAKK